MSPEWRCPLIKSASKEEAYSIEYLCKHRTKICAVHQFFKCRGLLGITEQGRSGVGGEVGGGLLTRGLWSWSNLLDFKHVMISPRKTQFVEFSAKKRCKLCFPFFFPLESCK